MLCICQLQSPFSSAPGPVVSGCCDCCDFHGPTLVYDHCLLLEIGLYVADIYPGGLRSLAVVLPIFQSFFTSTSLGPGPTMVSPSSVALGGSAGASSTFLKTTSTGTCNIVSGSLGLFFFVDLLPPLELANSTDGVGRCLHPKVFPTTFL